MLASITITRQVVYDGFVDGLSIGLLALGVVLIYRSSRVINFAVGALGAFSASLLALLVIQYHWNFWPAAIVAILAGAAFAAAVELTVITRLFRAPRVIVLVATIGIAELAAAAQVALPHIDEASMATPFPTPLTGTWTVAGVRVSGAEVSVMIAVGIRIAEAHPTHGVGLGGFERAYSKRTGKTANKSASNTPVWVGVLYLITASATPITMPAPSARGNDTMRASNAAASTRLSVFGPMVVRPMELPEVPARRISDTAESTPPIVHTNVDSNFGLIAERRRSTCFICLESLAQA